MHNRNAYYLHSYTINIINWQAPMFKMDLMMPCYVQTSISQPKTSETRGLSGSPGYARRHQKATLDEVRPGPSADPGWVWESLWWCITIHHPGSSIPRSIKQDDFIRFDEIPRWKQHRNNVIQFPPPSLGNDFVYKRDSFCTACGSNRPWPLVTLTL